MRPGNRSAGTASPRWRGGRYTKNGYVFVSVPDHPRASQNGYVQEHVVVMERVLGRHLKVDETVHHLNGIRADNRPENLELWVKPQPTGIRAADAVAWARTILELYG